MFDEAKDFMSQGIANELAAESIYFKEPAKKNSVYVVMSGERSLCGGYNANILKAALAKIEDNKGSNSQIIAVGATCKDYFVKRKKAVISSYDGVLENVSYEVAEDIAQRLIAMYIADTDWLNRADEIFIAYTQFETLLSHTPRVLRLLPFESYTADSPKEIIYEPNVHTYLKKSIPVYLAMFIYGAMVEASVCEQASRMTSMDSATRNAGEIVDNLTLQYNRQRQGAITQEISEIVGGANAI